MCVCVCVKERARNEHNWCLTFSTAFTSACFRCFDKENETRERERWKKIVVNAVVVVVVVVVRGVIAATTIRLDVKFVFTERRRRKGK